MNGYGGYWKSVGGVFFIKFAYASEVLLLLFGIGCYGVCVVGDVLLLAES